MMKKFSISLLMLFILAASCKKDDDFKDLPQDERNQVDDRAISDYLEDHYFDSDKGLIKKYKEEDEDDDDFPPLMSMATKLPSGVWIVVRPGVEAEGPAVTNNKTDSILISYNSMRFKATYDGLKEGQKAYEAGAGSFYNTIFSTGTPAWDPIFYHQFISPEMQEKGINEDHFQIKGFIEGLKHFKSTQTNGSELYNFQGAILVPSRMAYGREFVYLGGSLDPVSYRDNSFMFNFELHRVIPRQ